MISRLFLLFWLWQVSDSTNYYQWKKSILFHDFAFQFFLGPQIMWNWTRILLPNQTPVILDLFWTGTVRLCHQQFSSDTIPTSRPPLKLSSINNFPYASEPFFISLSFSRPLLLAWKLFTTFEWHVFFFVSIYVNNKLLVLFTISRESNNSLDQSSSLHLHLDSFWHRGKGNSKMAYWMNVENVVEWKEKRNWSL